MSMTDSRFGLASATLKQTIMSAETFPDAPNIIKVSFNTLSGNQPATYGNFVAIWQNPEEIPWNQDPLKQQSITVPTNYGTVTFDGLDLQTKPYVVGYGVGPDISNICSTVSIPVGGSPTEAFATSLSTVWVTEDTIAVRYKTPAGNRPHTGNNWIGLWRGTVAPYTGNDPIAKLVVPGDDDSSVVAFNGLGLMRNTTYTLAYFMGKSRSTMACTLTFNTSDVK